MKKSQFRRLVEECHPSSEGWALSEGIYYRSPVEWSIEGVTFENSSSGGVYIWALHAPLMAPLSALPLTWSSRMSFHGKSLLEDEDEIREAIFSAANEPVATLTTYGADTSPNLNVQEVRAYALVALNDANGAVARLEELSDRHVDQPWEQRVIERSRMILQLCLAHDWVSAMEKISTWRDSNRLALRVGDADGP